MDRLNLLGGQSNLLGGQMPAQLACYLSPCIPSFHTDPYAEYDAEPRSQI